MITAWRIVLRDHAQDAFSGKGASRFPGRWNTPGTAVVYVSDSAALAALEMLVHTDVEAVLPAYLLFACSFGEDLIERFDLGKLPSNWQDDPPPPALRQIGQQWVIEQRSAVLRIPSVIIPIQSNYLLNPAHPDFAKITIADPVSFALDLRLLRR